MQAQEIIDNLRLLKKVEHKISLEACELKSLWAEGILGDTAYVALVLKLEEHKWQTAKDFRFYEFILEWQAEYEDENQKPKVKILKIKAVREAIEKLQKSALAQVQQQLTLQLTW